MKIFRIIAFCCCSAAVADESGPASRDWPREIFIKADENRDGAITLEEFGLLPRIQQLPAEKRQALFQRLDNNGDGKLEARELPRPRWRRGQRGPFSMQKLDTNGDGTVGWPEFQQSPFAKRLPESRRRPLFERLDRDGDGVLSAEDGPPGRRGQHGRGRRPRMPFERVDRDGDGWVVFEEFRAIPHPGASGEEALGARFKELDRDDNLKLDRGEWPRSRRGPGTGQPRRRPFREPR